jgi:hypothetical protein
LRTIFSGWPGIKILLISTPQVARITGMRHEPLCLVITFSFFFFFSYAGVESRALHVLGKCSIIDLYPHAKLLIF